MNIPDPSTPGTDPGDIRVSFLEQPGPLGWFRRVTVRIDGDDVGELEPGESAKWTVDPGGHVVRVYDMWGRSADCQVTVQARARAHRGPAHLHCRVNPRRTAVVKLFVPLWLVSQWLPAFAWSLTPAAPPAQNAPTR